VAKEIGKELKKEDARSPLCLDTIDGLAEASYTVSCPLSFLIEDEEERRLFAGEERSPPFKK
jgi:hypothetical protein